MSERLDFRNHPRTHFEDVGELSHEEARREVEALRDGIEYHNHLYYVENKPKISDAVYDKLFRRLQELEEAFPGLRSESSPTRRVGGALLEELERVDHTAPMLSLRAVLEESEVEDFVRLIRGHSGKKAPAFVLEPKFDGMSIEAVYEKGRFVRGTTRGDGRTGEDITHNLRTIHTVPLRLRNPDRAPERLAVRGEVILPVDDFQQVNKERIEVGEEPFANPRNAVAGTLRRLDPKQVARQPLEVFFYDILDLEGRRPDTHWGELEKLQAWGLRVDEHNRRVHSIDAIRDYHERLAGQRDDLPFEIDGIVIKSDDVDLHGELGTRDRSPRWALAWKFEPRQEVTELEEIAVQVGMTGMLTPVALLQPVDVGGVTVSRATLHNEDEVHRKDVRPDDKVRIARAGDVIPEVIERIKQPGKKRGEPFSMPDTCPACGAEVVRQGAYHFCPAGISCPPQLVGHVVHYASQEAMDIDGLGERTARMLVDEGLVRDLGDLYGLTVKDLRKLAGFAEKSARKLREAIQDARRPRLDRFLYALGIRHVGRRIARLLARRFGSLDALREADRQRLEEIPEIGPEIAESVERFLREPATHDVLNHLLKAGVQVQDMPKNAHRHSLEGKTFVFTGSLEDFTRSEAQRRVERLGARAASSVSRRTDYVVVGKNPGHKLDDAKQEHVKQLDEKTFKKMLSSA